MHGVAASITMARNFLKHCPGSDEMRSPQFGSNHDELVSEFGALPLPDRVALLEEYHDERARASVRAAQYPSVQGTLQSAAQPRPYEVCILLLLLLLLLM